MICGHGSKTLTILPGLRVSVGSTRARVCRITCRPYVAHLESEAPSHVYQPPHRATENADHFLAQPAVRRMMNRRLDDGGVDAHLPAPCYADSRGDRHQPKQQLPQRRSIHDLSESDEGLGMPHRFGNTKPNSTTCDNSSCACRRRTILFSDHTSTDLSIPSMNAPSRPRRRPHIRPFSPQAGRRDRKRSFSHRPGGPAPESAYDPRPFCTVV